VIDLFGFGWDSGAPGGASDEFLDIGFRNAPRIPDEDAILVAPPHYYGATAKHFHSKLYARTA
jgi:hypothetical protein